MFGAGVRIPPSSLPINRPPGCPDDVYGHMKSCWHAQPDGRPTFADLVAAMELITPGLSNTSTTA